MWGLVSIITVSTFPIPESATERKERREGDGEEQEKRDDMNVAREEVMRVG